MIENSKVMIRIEYIRDGIRRASLGKIDENKLDEIKKEYERDEMRGVSREEISENKLDELHLGEESFICLRNDGKIAWIDKEVILSFYELETKTRVYEKCCMEEATFAINQGLKIKT